MPHNNRMSTSASLKTHAIWQTAIGHDPYANEAEKEENARDTKVDQEKLEKVMVLARSQNITDGAQRNDFTARMYLGLKKGKQRRGEADTHNQAIDPNLQSILEDPSSSSEEEFVELEVKREEKRRRKKSSRKKESKRRRYSSSSDSSDDESSERYRRKRQRKSSKSRKSRRRSDSVNDSTDSSVDRKRSRGKRRKDDKKRSKRDSSEH